MTLLHGSGDTGYEILPNSPFPLLLPAVYIRALQYKNVTYKSIIKKHGMKKVLITDANKSIGFETARQLFVKHSIGENHLRDS